MPKSQTARVGNKVKARRAVHLKTYYLARPLVTATNKRRREERRKRKKAKWRAIGVKKNGKAVK